MTERNLARIKQLHRMGRRCDMKHAQVLVAVLLIGLATMPAAAENEPGFRYGSERFFGANLPAQVRQKLFEIEEEMNNRRKQVFDEFVIRRYLTESSAAEGKSPEQLQQELLAVPWPDDATVRKFYDDNRERIRRPFEQIKNEITQYLRQQQERERVGALLDRIEKDKGYAAILPEPERPVLQITVDGYPYKGGADAKVTVVEFADYQCPHCKSVTKVIGRLIETFGDKVRVVYRDFPVNPSGVSREIAKGAVCADQQGAFWEYHNLAFDRQDTLRADSASGLATDLLLDMGAFKACLESPQPEAKVAMSEAEAIELGVSGTPTFFVNGRALHVHGDIEKPLLDAVEAALAQAS